MARVIGGFGVSHSPSMGYEYDKGIAGKFDPRWKIWHDGLQPVKRWLAEAKPDQIVIVYNDHLNHFTFEAYPTLALGVAETFPQDLNYRSGRLGRGYDEPTHAAYGSRNLEGFPKRPRRFNLLRLPQRQQQLRRTIRKC